MGVVSVVTMATLRLRNEHSRVTTQIVLAAPIDTARMVVFEYSEASGRSEGGGVPELTSTSSVAQNVVEPSNMAISRNRSPTAGAHAVTSPVSAGRSRASSMTREEKKLVKADFEVESILVEMSEPSAADEHTSRV